MSKYIYMVHKLIAYVWTSDRVESKAESRQVDSDMISVKCFYVLAGSGPITCQKYGVELEVYTRILGGSRRRKYVRDAWRKAGSRY